MKAVKADLPHLTTFATLSPIPRFRHWLMDELKQPQRQPLTATEAEALRCALGGLWGKVHSPQEALAAMVEEWVDSVSNGEDAVGDAASSVAMDSVAKAILMRLCAHFLTQVKGHNLFPHDPVARFHLSNGASLHRIHWMADTSVKGRRESLGLMVNYMYELSQIEENHEQYATGRKVVYSEAIAQLLG